MISIIFMIMIPVLSVLTLLVYIIIITEKRFDIGSIYALNAYKNMDPYKLLYDSIYNKNFDIRKYYACECCKEIYNLDIDGIKIEENQGKYHISSKKHDIYISKSIFRDSFRKERPLGELIDSFEDINIYAFINDILIPIIKQDNNHSNISEHVCYLYFYTMFNWCYNHPVQKIDPTYYLF